jgi:endonuclease G
MCPQDAHFNRGYWSSVERFTRSLTAHFNDVYIFTGPLYLPEEDAEGNAWVKYRVIGTPPRLAVPTHFFKGC